MDKNALKKELLSRLPDGCSPDDDLLDRIAGGLARTYDAKIIRPPFPKGQPGGLADKGDLAVVLSDRYLLPDKFASLADMEQWFADNLA